MTTELKVTEELFQQALKAYGSFEIARSNAERVSMRQGFELGMQYARHHQADVATVERVVQFLHDEGGFDEAWSESASWPEHPDDTGQREGGYVRIVPSDVQAKFRDVAQRLCLQFPKAAATIKELKAEVEALGREHDTATREWALAEARAAKAEEALRRIKARATTHPDDNDSDRKRDLLHVVGIAREALGEEKA